MLSATDLVNFLGCRYSVIQDLFVVQGKKEKPVIDGDQQVIQNAGLEHEKAFLEQLRKSGLSIVEISTEGSLQEGYKQTIEAMLLGAEVIFQGALLSTPWHGYTDFLIKTGAPSKLGAFSYFPLDTKLKRIPTATHFIQLGLYADLLETVQGAFPKEVKLVLGDFSHEVLAASEVIFYLREAKKRLEAFVLSPDRSREPEPCKHCNLCRWKDECEATWAKRDHLCRVANIRRSQIEKLRAANIKTLGQLALTDENLRISHLSPETFLRVRKQAILQQKKNQTGKNEVYVLPLEIERGFHRLPQPDSGDLFFDMEGDPLYPKGLEYLFGVYHKLKNGEFFAFWGHDHDEEKKAFEDVMSLFVTHLAKHPNAHIYHYNHYEETALKRLSTQYGTCEEEVDDLLRKGKLIDLYKIVREAIMISEPSYSLKNLEVFYLPKRAGEVKNAAQSIAVYEEWRRRKDRALLIEIEKYNRIDCESTASCLDWLISLRPQETPWYARTIKAEEEHENAQKIKEENKRLEQELLDEKSYSEAYAGKLVSHMLGFHRREEKTHWWKIFSLQNASESELIEDAECLGALRQLGAPKPEKRSFVYRFSFPPQETKRREGEMPFTSNELGCAGTIFSLDPKSGIVELKRSKNLGAPPQALSLLPPRPVDSKVLRGAIKRFAESYAKCEEKFAAIRSLLKHELPKFAVSGVNFPVRGEIEPESILKTVSELKDSVLFIQGPPGAGKTFLSARIILGLLKIGKRIAVSSNSHKAIINIIEGVEIAAIGNNFTFKGAKKSNLDDPATLISGRFIRDVGNKDQIKADDALVAGTVWLFADEKFEESFDFLFVDEAGQVSLANLIAMGTSAKNIVLIGDQMQLSQPVQGSHPGESGDSALDYLLQGKSTVPEEQGIFLNTTWRLHPDICGFISEAVYDGRLRAHTDNIRQVLSLGNDAHPALKPSGITFIPVEHSGCSQKSTSEGVLINGLYQNLLKQHYFDRKGERHSFKPENILVISPFNVQVNYLKSILPQTARVGTVDKFQGQEAEAVLISMVTSGVDELPRNIEFLFSRNRLNVAVSRARSLAVILANPGLLEIPCDTIEQLSLVNTLCYLKAWSEQ